MTFSALAGYGPLGKEVISTYNAQTTDLTAGLSFPSRYPLQSRKPLVWTEGLFGETSLAVFEKVGFATRRPPEWE
jgi:hypothetical protein